MYRKGAARKLATGGFHTSGYNFLADMDPFVFHEQLTTFCHPLDGYCNIDYPNGKLCSYGDTLIGTNKTGGLDLESVYSNIVGFNGPLLNVANLNPAPSAWFSETHFWAHSLNFFLILANDGNKFLSATGDTDGGCRNATIATAQDPNNMCPKGAY